MMNKIFSIQVKSILTNEQISEYKDAFSFFDKNNNGYFMISDLQEIMASLEMQITDNELLDIIDEIKTEKIDFKTFKSILVARVFQEKEEIHAVFNMIDMVSHCAHQLLAYISGKPDKNALTHITNATPPTRTLTTAVATS